MVVTPFLIYLLLTVSSKENTKFEKMKSDFCISKGVCDEDVLVR